MIGIGLDLLLIVLLVGALYLGVRLEKKLRYLRETQAGFAGAAAELNMAIARAEGGLQELKMVAGEAQLVLGDRLQDARSLDARLTQKMTLADKAASGLELQLAAVERAAAGVDQRVAAAQRASAGLEALVRRAEVSRPPSPASPVLPPEGGDLRRGSSPPGGSPAEGREGGQPRLGHLAMLRRDAAARREALAAPPASEAGELYLEQPLKPEALSRRPGRVDDDLFEPARTAAGARR